MSSCAFTPIVRQRLERAPQMRQYLQMDHELTREERLAAKLRENLRRRKIQARALSAGGDDSAAAPLSNVAEDS